jgi:hypothetical protein
VSDKKIYFLPNSTQPEFNQYLEIPKPSINFMPKWWKDQKLELGKNASDPLGIDSLSFKACMPFLDSLTTGYMGYTHQELLVKEEDGMPSIRWKTGPEPLSFRTNSGSLPIPAGFHDSHFTWHFNFGMQLPKGYSAIFTHPFNRFDLPFFTVSGIVDQGVAWGGKFTFWIKKGFNGIIPKDTPFVQIIPFNRENWQSEKLEDMDLVRKMKHEKNRVINGFYKKNIHQKKSFK